MRIHFALISTVALLAACSNADKAKTTTETASVPAASATVAPPAPKAGLWEQTMSGGPIPAPMVVKMCVGETAPGANPFAVPATPGTDCTQTSKAIPGGAEFHSTCNTDGRIVTSDGKVSGNMESAYKVEIATTTTGPNVPPQVGDMKMTIDAKRLGDCPAGAQPNSIVR